MINGAYSFRRFSAFPCGRLAMPVSRSVQWLVMNFRSAGIPDCPGRQGKKEQIETQVYFPGHMAQNTAAGAGDPIPRAQQHQGDIGSKYAEQHERKQQPQEPAPPEKNQPAGDELGERQCPGQYACQGMRNILIGQLSLKGGVIQQLAECGIYPEQDQQGRSYRLDVRDLMNMPRWTCRGCALRFHESKESGLRHAETV